MKNHTAMGDILTMTPSELENLPVDQLILIQQEIAASAEYLKKVKLVFDGALEGRYEKSIKTAYKNKGEVYGKTSFLDGDAEVEVNTPKKISWDADQMKHIERTIAKQWQSNPEEYIQIKRTVSETAWNSWPSEIKELFADARTEDVGKRSIVLKEKAKQEAA